MFPLHVRIRASLAGRHFDCAGRRTRRGRRPILPEADAVAGVLLIERVRLQARIELARLQRRRLNHAPRKQARRVSRSDVDERSLRATGLDRIDAQPVAAAIRHDGQIALLAAELDAVGYVYIVEAAERCPFAFGTRAWRAGVDAGRASADPAGKSLAGSAERAAERCVPSGRTPPGPHLSACR